MIISDWSLFDEQYVCLNRGSRSSLIRLSSIIGESLRECIGDSSMNSRQLVNIHRMDWRMSTQLSSIICRESGVEVSVSSSIPRNPGIRNILWVSLFRNSGTVVPGAWNPSEFSVPRNLRTRISAGSPFPETGAREPVVNCSKIKDRLCPDICVSKNTRKRFFRRVPGSLTNGTLRNGNHDTSSPVCEIPIGELPTSLSVIRKVEVARRKF
jgi:hypothetical protein